MALLAGTVIADRHTQLNATTETKRKVNHG